MKVINVPCKDCKVRSVGCHGRCRRYQEYRRILSEEVRKENAYKIATRRTKVRVERLNSKVLISPLKDHKK